MEDIVQEIKPPVEIRDDMSYFNDNGQTILFLTLSRPLYDHYVQQVKIGEHAEAFESSVCGVCHDNLEPSCIVRRILVCGHLFHESCLEHWLGKCESCPLCGTLLEREYLRVMRPNIEKFRIEDTYGSLTQTSSEN